MKRFEKAIPELVRLMFYTSELQKIVNDTKLNGKFTDDENEMMSMLHTIIGVNRMANNMLDKYDDFIQKTMNIYAQTLKNKDESTLTVVK